MLSANAVGVGATEPAERCAAKGIGGGVDTAGIVDELRAGLHSWLCRYWAPRDEEAMRNAPPPTRRFCGCALRIENGTGRVARTHCYAQRREGSPRACLSLDRETRHGGSPPHAPPDAAPRPENRPRRRRTTLRPQHRPPEPRPQASREKQRQPVSPDDFHRGHRRAFADCPLGLK